jgi:hypothetical protein
MTTPFKDLVRIMWSEGPEELNVRPLLGALRNANGGVGFTDRDPNSATSSARVLLDALANESPVLFALFRITIAENRPACQSCTVVHPPRIVSNILKSLAIPPPGTHARLADLLRDAFRDSAERRGCATCLANPEIPIARRVLVAPRVLVLGIDALSVSGRHEVFGSVDFLPEFNLADFAHTDVERRYRLKGIVRPIPGHFTAEYLHPETGMWVSVDDARVRPMADGPVNGRAASILIYEAF